MLVIAEGGLWNGRDAAWALARPQTVVAQPVTCRGSVAWLLRRGLAYNTVEVEHLLWDPAMMAANEAMAERWETIEGGGVGAVNLDDGENLRG